MRRDVMIDGVSLSDYFIVVDAAMSPLSIRGDGTEIAGRDGVVLAEATYAERTIDVTLLLPSGTLEERHAAMRAFYARVDLKEEHRLYLSVDDGIYYEVRADGDIEIEHGVTATKVVLHFVSEKPAGYGEEHTVTIPSGSSATFTVGGNYPTRPTIEGTVNGNNDGNWGVRLDGGDYVRVKTNTTQGRAVSIDCEEGIAIVNSLVSMISLESDWLVLYHGEHTITNDVGTGACTVTWRERWL